MATNHTWKLIVTPLNAQGETREATVNADNWLSALRLARAQLGEEGGVPTGASCVMSASGEVTILDAENRRRYTLGRAPREAGEGTVEKPAAPKSELPLSAAAHNSALLAQSTAKRSTVAYSPEESAAARAQLLAAPKAAAQSPLLGERGQAAPANATSATSATAAPAQRKVTVAYSPEESAALRAPLLEAQKLVGGAPTPAPTPAPAPVAPPQVAPASAVRAPTPVGAPQAPASSAQGAPHAAAPQRKATVAYSAEESSALRSELVQAYKAASAAMPSSRPPPAATSAAPARKGTVEYSPEQSAKIRASAGAQNVSAPLLAQPAPPAQGLPAAKRSATMAYVESPFVGGVLIVVSSRDEEPSASSPLTYRERCYYAREHVARERLEALLREELEKVRATLSGRARGQFVNLAVFDHHFQGKPQKKPIATLQWKDWRGDPVFALGDESNAPVWTSTSEPPRTSFVPDARPSSPAAPAPRTAPVSALYTPARAVVPAPEEPRATGFAREGTGDQDRRLAVAFEAVQDLYFLGTPLDGLEFAVKLLTDLVPCEAVSGGLYDINTDEFRFVAVTGPGATERRAQAVPLSAAGLLGAAVRSGEEVFLVAEAGADARFDAMADGRAGLLPRNILYLPLHKAENLLGVLQLINRENPRGFSEGDKAVSSYVAKQVADFLQSRRQVGPRRR